MIRSTLLYLFVAACGGGAAPAPSTSPVRPTAHADRRERLELRHDVWVNLHQRLYAETSPERSREAPQPGADSFTADERAAWEGALDLYRRRNPTETRNLGTVFEDSLVDVNRRLSALKSDEGLAASGLDSELVARLRAAAVVYRAHGWPSDDRSNQAWIDALRPKLDQFGETVARDLEAAYETPWPDAPIRVEVAFDAGPLGAHTVDGPGLVTINSSRKTYQGDAALEMVFHEATHAFAGTAIEDAIARECAAQKKPVPQDLWHAVIFYTAGDLVRRRIAGYVPYANANGLYERSPQWTVYERLLKEHWQPHLDGEVDRNTALRSLIAALPAEHE